MITRLAIISALATEASCFSANGQLPVRKVICFNHSDVFISGMGAENAHSAALTLIGSGAKALVSWGTAGALSTDLRPGDIIIPEHIAGETGQLFQTPAEWRVHLIKQLTSTLQVCSDKLVQSNTVISSVAQKQSLHVSSGASAVDMESATIAEIAAQHDLPMLSIRVIVDPADETIPCTAIRCIDEFGRIKLAALITSLISKPGDIPGLIKLGKHFKQVQRTQKQIVSITGQRLALPSNLPG